MMSLHDHISMLPGNFLSKSCYHNSHILKVLFTTLFTTNHWDIVFQPVKPKSFYTKAVHKIIPMGGASGKRHGNKYRPVDRLGQRSVRRYCIDYLLYLRKLEANQYISTTWILRLNKNTLYYSCGMFQKCEICGLGFDELFFLSIGFTKQCNIL